MKTTVEKKIADRILSIETGHVARQADGAVIVQYGDTVVLAAAVAQPDARNVPFLPLSIEYREKQYAAGQIPGSIFRREGRPTTKEVLTCRVIDRPSRPLFPKGYHEEIQVHAFVLSSDGENDPDVLAMIAASTALAISDIPWNGPTASCRIGLVNDEFIVNPTYEQRAECELDLVVSSTEKAIIMVEGGASVIPEEDLLTAVECAHDTNLEVLALVNELVEKVGKPDRAWEPHIDATRASDLLGDRYYARFVEAHHTRGQRERQAALRALKDAAVEEFCDADNEEAPVRGEISAAFDEFESRAMREDVVQHGRRGDGRALDELRELSCEVALLLRTHGSALFTRGETQVLAVTTLGSVRDQMRVLDPMVETPNKTFLLHYNFPPFSVGEVRPARGPGRRDIGHGCLAERAIQSVLPSSDDFPYTIRVVSEVTESNGSSSMATVCGTTLALMDAGVPIHNPVAGIAMGLIKDGDNVHILTDIAGAEDHHGDMDLKVAGTQHGITAIQMDLKVEGIGSDVLRKALEQAKQARLAILRVMLQALDRPRESISPYAPVLLQVQIDPDLIGRLIGPGGKNIKGLQEEYGVNIDVVDDGTVTVSGSDADAARRAIEYIGLMGQKVQAGAIYEGTVTELKGFGAIVQIFPGADGLCHISELSDTYVGDVTDVCKVGDKMKVKVLRVDGNSVRLSRKAAMAEEKKQD